MDLKELMKMNLQMFAEPDEGEGSNPGEPEDSTDPPKSGDELKDAQETKSKAKYTDDDVDKIINEKFAKWQEKQAEKIAEAEKLAKMNADEKEKYRLEQLEKELEEYKRKDTFYSLSKEASKMLSEQNIHADDELLQLIVKDNAEETQKAVNSFVALINTKVEEGVKKALQGKPPKVNTQTGKPITKESIMSIKDSGERLKAIRENGHLFN